MRSLAARIAVIGAVCSVTWMVAASHSIASPPAAARVDAIYRRADCSSSDCAGATPISAGSIVTGTIQIHVSVDGGVGLIDRMRLEAKPPGTDKYICLEQWFGDQHQSLSKYYDWESAQWPKPYKGWGCPEALPHYHGEPSANGDYAVRVTGYNVNDDNPTHSAEFSVRLSNAPKPPSWFEKPSPHPAQDGSPTVLLRWNQNRETDVSEYHFIRVGPDHRVREFAVDAHDPPDQGCYKTTSILYACVDRDFSGQRSGTYRYALVAIRPGPGATTRCSLSSARCIESKASETQDVAVSVQAHSSRAPSNPNGASLPTLPSSGPSPSAPSAVPTTAAAADPALNGALVGGGLTRNRTWLCVAAGGVAFAVLGMTLGVIRRRKGFRVPSSNQDA